MSLPARLLLPALLASLLGPGALLARPAHAGRASACKAPPFAVPKETQRAVDAAIDARVVGMGAGGLSSTVETHIDYETTTLSQDAAARSWVEYTLCLKLAKKLISQELHDELLRALLAPAPSGKLEEVPEVAPTAPNGQGQATKAEPAQPLVAASALTGTWHVTSTFRWSTCPPPNDVAGVSAYSWLVSLKSDDTLDVQVLGATSYPSLRGTFQDGHLLLQGDQVRSPVDSPNGLMTSDGEDYVLYRPRVFIFATSDGSTLQGTRDLTTLVGPTKVESSPTGPANLYELCMMHYDLVGHR